MSKLEKLKEGLYILPKEGGMKVPGLIVANEKVLEEIEIEKPLEQVRNVAFLPGIIGYSIAMPDIHWGYGFPIGGVAGMDIETGVISPGGVGYDINCGVRIAIIPVKFKDLSEKDKKNLLKAIFKNVPSGIGRGHTKERGLSDRDYKEIAEKGVRWALDQGFALKQDLDHIESYGCIEGADINAVSNTAKERGRHQLGSIGSGNHFIEIGEIQKIFLDDIASEWEVELGLTYILIHSGSRGFGHQTCQDSLDKFYAAGLAKDLPDRQLVAAPIKSDLGQKYFKAMAAAANFAFNNRQRILHEIRQCIQEVLSIPPEKVKLIYDVCHNIAKFEDHTIEGTKYKLCVHRKGATRAFGAGHPDLAPLFRKTGQPVLVPGDMARASYLLVGKGNSLTLSSSCHGAGRAKSRIQSKKEYRGKDVYQIMKEQDVEVMATSIRTISEEMPSAYKDVDIVVEATQEAGLTDRVAKFKPHLVIKG